MPEYESEGNGDDNNENGPQLIERRYTKLLGPCNQQLMQSILDHYDPNASRMVHTFLTYCIQKHFFFSGLRQSEELSVFVFWNTNGVFHSWIIVHKRSPGSHNNMYKLNEIGYRTSVFVFQIWLLLYFLKLKYHTSRELFPNKIILAASYHDYFVISFHRSASTVFQTDHIKEAGRSKCYKVNGKLFKQFH